MRAKGFFCAGGDRATLGAAGEDPANPDTYAGMGAIYRSFARVGELEPPTIAAVRGGAVGAGLNLMMATDLRIVARDGARDLRLHPDRPAPRRRPRRAARSHRRARGRRRR